VKGGMADDVIASKTSLGKAAKAVSGKASKTPKKKVSKVKTLEELVWDKWDKFVKGFAPNQRRQVKDIVRGFLIEDDKK
jgi:hypothetical protein